MKKMFFVIAIITMSIFSAQAGDKKGNGVLHGKEYGLHAQNNELQQFLLHYTEPDYKKKYKKILAFDVNSAGDSYKQFLAEVFPGEKFEDILSGSEEIDLPADLSGEYFIGYVPLDATSFEWFSRKSHIAEKGLRYKGIFWASTYCWNPIKKKPAVKQQTVATVPVAPPQQQVVTTPAPAVVYQPAPQQQVVTQQPVTVLPIQTQYVMYQQPQVVYVQQPQQIVYNTGYSGCNGYGYYGGNYSFGDHVLSSAVNVGAYWAKSAIRNSYQNNNSYQQNNSYQHTNTNYSNNNSNQSGGGPRSAATYSHH
ncbi:MAG: hypothetical protein WCQ32_00540 [bacterium]